VDCGVEVCSNSRCRWQSSSIDDLLHAGPPTKPEDRHRSGGRAACCIRRLRDRDLPLSSDPRQRGQVLERHRCACRVPGDGSRSHYGAPGMESEPTTGFVGDGPGRDVVTAGVVPPWTRCRCPSSGARPKWPSWTIGSTEAIPLHPCWSWVRQASGSRVCWPIGQARCMTGGRWTFSVSTLAASASRAAGQPGSRKTVADARHPGKLPRRHQQQR
jgi:hypothetical protein